ncbi:MAG: hypothetical protein R3F65_20565 [bacterium]
MRWTTTMAVKRLFEEEGVPARIVGASSVEAAINQLKKNDRYRAVLIQWDEAGRLALELACAVKERGRPSIVAFQKEWDRDDVRRALQLGVDSLLYDPFSIDELFADLKALTEEGVSKTRAQLLGEGGEALLAADPALWTQQDDDWRGRMMALADQMQRPWSEGMAKKADDLEASLRRANEDGEGEVDPALARAVMAVLDQGRDRLPELAREHRVEARTLARVADAVEAFAEQNGGPARIPLLMSEVVHKADPRSEADPGKLMVLKRVARVVLRTGGRSGRRKDALNESLRRMLGVPMPVLDGLTPDERVDLCGRLLFAETEEEALDACRLLVLANMLAAVDRVPVNPNHLHALAALFGLKARIEGIEPESLLQRLAVQNPLPVLYDVDLLDLEPFRERIPNPPASALDKALAGVLDGLLEAAAPFGDLDQRRLSGLLAAVRNESAVLIGRPTWRTFQAALQGAPPPPVDRLVDRLTFAMGARSAAARKLLQKALGDLIEVGRNALDAARFVEFCRAAASEPLGRDVIEEYAAEAPAEFTPERRLRPGAAEEVALVEDALSRARALGLDPAVVRENLPPAPRIATRLSAEEMTRMRVVAAGLWERSLPEQEALVGRALPGGRLKVPELAALEAMLGEGPTVAMLRARTAPGSEAADRPLVEHFERGLTGPMAPIKRPEPGSDARRRADELIAARGEERWAARPDRRPSVEEVDPIAALADETSPRVPVWSKRPTGPVGDDDDAAFGTPPPPPPGAVPVDLTAVERWIAQGDLDAAAERLRSVLDGTPNLPEALNLVALHLYVAGRRTTAGALWERAVRLGPDRLNILFNLARLRVEMGQPAEARPLLRRVLMRRPHLTPGRLLFARVRDEMRAGVR